VTQLQHRPPRVLDLQSEQAARRRRRARVLIVAVPLVPFTTAFLAAGAPLLSWWPLLAGAGLAAVLGTVSGIARWSARREARP
jgi:hypothetical protein